MEAPTPVSALLHAGLLNAGPFLMIRFSYVLDAVQIAPVALFSIGFISALFGALVFITQPLVKTSLAYSSIAHMGFTLMVSGLGIYSASLLHLVGHSFYKAHAFLSSGSVIDKVRTKKASTFARKGSVLKMILGMTIAIAVYLLIANLLHIDLLENYQLFILGGIILSGVIGLLVNAVDSGNNSNSIFKIVGIAALVILLFFGFEELFDLMLGNQIPELSAPSYAIKFISTLALMIFFTTIVFQALVPLVSGSVAYRNFGIHIRNGLYANVIFDRLINTLVSEEAKNKGVTKTQK
jgi:NAD(P)H-quinone oxidoreductase subunit 5